MPFNLLLFPLVAGYYIIACSEWFRYRTQRLHNERLIFNSVIAGVFLLASCFFIKSLFWLWAPDIVKAIKGIMPVRQDYFGVMIVSFFIGIGFVEVTNLFIKEDARIKLAINKIGNDFEKLLLHSSTNRELIMLTLKSEKVYVGICSRIPIPDKSSYINLLPFFSGYRDPETKEVDFTTDYLDIYSDIIREGKAVSIMDMEVNVVICTSEVITASLFNVDIYDRFSKKNAGSPPQTNP